MLTRMRQRWPWRWRTTWSTAVEGGLGAPSTDQLTAEQRGNVTSVNRVLLEQLFGPSNATWVAQGLWSCLDGLRLVTGAGAEVHLEQAWTDGPDAFCVVYAPPYQPAERVGLRRQIHDTDPGDRGSGAGPSYAALLSPMSAEVGSDGEWNPVGFGQMVAVYDIGEPIGKVRYMLRTDSQGVGWWGALQVELPRQPGIEL